jgi:hypothetical protein
MPKAKISLNAKGQIAIFVALVFQVLFVFFAMVINVGLLVHQKINLQNSVDLAAYYAAMKQADGLNAVAHINYQIRQSWKLMTWRYQQIGMAGETKVHPYNYIGKVFSSEDDSTPVSYFSANCQAYSPFEIYSGSENYCKNMPTGATDTLSIPVPSVSTPFASGFFTFAVTVANVTKNLGVQAQKGCNQVGAINWYTLARFLAAYKMDVTSRKQMLYLVANGMSKTTSDFFDVDGESVREGVLKTLKKNLSPENRDSASLKDSDIQFFNSLGDSNCGFSDDKSPPKWLNEVNIAPTFFFMETDCSKGQDANSTKFFLKPVVQFGATTNVNSLGTLDGPAIPFLKERILEYDGATPLERLYKASAGFEKNPWCMAYVGVSAKTTPSIPFSPFGRITLTAKAFAKPFGGRIGPWYGTKWTSGNNQSDLTTKIDTRAPERVSPGSFPTPPVNNAAALNDVNLSPNYSRFPGDQVGLRSNMSTGRWAQAIHKLPSISFSWWDQIIEQPVESPNTDGDILAWDKGSNSAPGMRALEVAAISPDLFDMTYYSIEPDFYRNYVVRLDKRPDRGSTFIRGDLGARKLSGDQKLREFGIKDQIALIKDDTKAPADFKNKLVYHVMDFGNLLNSWQGKNQEDYSIDPDRFGKCNANPEFGPIPDGQPAAKATTGNCRVGGRTGYSVKLVDEQYLKRSDLNIGGDGTSGPIKNPLPSGF